MLKVKTHYLKEIQPLTNAPLKLGDHSADVKKLQEWLLIWQLNQNYCDEIIKLDSSFGNKTLSLLNEVQKFIDLPTKPQVDQDDWKTIIKPLVEALSTNAYNKKSINDRITYFALKHIQYRACELIENNQGPWVRSYMHGLEGEWQYWCQGFVCTVLDQAYSSMGKTFTDYLPNTVTCQNMRQYAQTKNLLIPYQDLHANSTQTPTAGDLVLYVNKKADRATHTGIVHEVLDTEGNILTIEGNTNFSGSRSGVGVFIVSRNYKQEAIDIVKVPAP